MLVHKHLALRCVVSPLCPRRPLAVVDLFRPGCPRVPRYCRTRLARDGYVGGCMLSAPLRGLPQQGPQRLKSHILRHCHDTGRSAPNASHLSKVKSQNSFPSTLALWHTGGGGTQRSDDFRSGEASTPFRWEPKCFDTRPRSHDKVFLHSLSHRLRARLGNIAWSITWCFNKLWSAHCLR